MYWIQKVEKLRNATLTKEAKSIFPQCRWSAIFVQLSVSCSHQIQQVTPQKHTHTQNHNNTRKSFIRTQTVLKRNNNMIGHSERNG